MSIYFQKSHQRGFGTFPNTGEVLLKAIADAVDVGYRAFDTAQMYGNEAETGEALAASGLAREDLCITTKVHPDNYGEGAFLASIEQSLRDLRVDYVDALLLHWPPVNGNDLPAVLKRLEQAQLSGLTRAIGVSNFTVRLMRDAALMIDTPLVTNQVEFHPLLNQKVLLAGASEIGIPLSSYASVARGEIFKYPVFAEIGELCGKTAAQVALRWILQKGVTLNTMSTKPDNIRANFDIMDFCLSNVDMARIDALGRANYRIVTSDRVPWAPVWD